MKAAKVSRGRLQVPVRTYTGPGGRTVTLVGMMHIGEPSYYTRVQSLVDGLQRAGAAVQYEGIRDSTPAELAAATPDELAGVHALRRYILLGLRIAKAAGWASQHAAIHRGDDWINIDFSELDMVRMMTPAVVIKQATGVFTGPLALDGTDGESTLEAVTPFVLRTLGTPSILRFINLFGSRADRARERRFDYVILNERNGLAFTESLKAGQDVVLMWGANHLIGIQAALRRERYRPTSCTWFTVGPVPSWRTATTSLWSVIKAGRPEAPPEPT